MQQDDASLVALKEKNRRQARRQKELIRDAALQAEELATLKEAFENQTKENELLKNNLQTERTLRQAAETAQACKDNDAATARELVAEISSLRNALRRESILRKEADSDLESIRRLEDEARSIAVEKIAMLRSEYEQHYYTQQERIFAADSIAKVANEQRKTVEQDYSGAQKKLSKLQRDSDSLRDELKRSHELVEELRIAQRKNTHLKKDLADQLKRENKARENIERKLQQLLESQAVKGIPVERMEPVNYSKI